MPAIGYLGGITVMDFVASYAHWIAFALLLIVGIKMLFEALSEGVEEDIKQITHKVLLILAIATSIDAMAAGFTLHLLSVSPLLSCILIGVTTFVFSYVGTYVGARSGPFLESKAELLGACILIVMAFKFLLFP